MTDAPKVGADNAGRDDARSSVRRRDRGKDEAWVRAFLHQAPFGFLATVGEGGQQHVLERRALGEQVVVLEDEADRVPPQRGAVDALASTVEATPDAVRAGSGDTSAGAVAASTSNHGTKRNIGTPARPRPHPSSYRHSALAAAHGASPRQTASSE